MRLVILAILLLPTIAHAAPLIPAVLMFLGFKVAALIATVAILAHGKMKARRLARQARDAAFARLQDRSVSQIATEAPHIYIYGRAKVGSAVVAIFTGGENDQYKYLVCVHAAHECDAIEEIYVAGKALGTLDGNGDVIGGDYHFKTTELGGTSFTAFPGSTFTIPHSDVIPSSVVVYSNLGEGDVAIASTYDPATRVVSISGSAFVSLLVTVTWNYTVGRSRVRVRKHLGMVSDPADSMLLSEVSSKWAASAVLRGFCYTVIRIDLNQADFQGGPPPVEALIRGKKLYDFRSGLTAWSDNNVLAIYDYLTSEICGVDAADLPLAQFIAAANVCDEVQPFGKRYTLNGAVSSDEDKRNVVERMVTSMAGDIVDTTWDIYAGKYAAPIMSLYVDKADGNGDVIGKIEVASGVPEDQLWNGVRGQYISSETQYVATDFPPYQNLSYVVADGLELWQNLDFPFTDSAQRAHNLCRIMTEDQRNGYTVKAEFSLKAWAVKFGQRLTLTSTVFGWNAKVFRVVNRRFVPLSGGVELTLKEDTAEIWDFADAVTVDATPNTNLPNPFAIDPLVSLTCTSGTDDLLIAQDGTIISRIRAVWPQATTQAVVTNGRIEVEWQRVGSGVWQRAEARGDDVEMFLSPVQDGLFYALRGRTVNLYLNVKSSWTYAPNHKVIGKTEPPPDMGNLSISGAILNWAEVSRTVVRDYDGAVFRFHHGDNRDWGSAIPLHRGLIGAAPFDMLTRPSGVVTILGKHRDYSGNESMQAAVIVTNLGDPVIANVVETIDFKADGFPGTISGGIVSGGNLIARDLDSAYGTDDQSFYGPDNDPAYDESAYGQVIYTTGEIAINSALAGSLLTIQHTTQGTDLFIEYRLSGLGSAYGRDSDSAYGPSEDLAVMDWGLLAAVTPGETLDLGSIADASTTTYDLRGL